jgi:hypothetical protein
MAEIYLAYMYGDFDVSIVIGVATDPIAAEKIIRSVAKKSGYELKDIGNGKFKNTSCNTSNDCDYWFKDVRLNKPII